MKKFLKKYVNILSFTVAIIVCISFFIYTLALIASYSSKANEEAVERAEFYTKEQSLYIEGQCNYLKTETNYFATKLSECATQDEFDEAVKNIQILASTNEFFADFLYVKNDQLIAWNGDEVTEYPELDALKSAENTELSQIFQYKNRIMAIASSAELDSPFTDRVVAVFDSMAISVSDYAYDENHKQLTCVEKSEFTLLCKHDGKIIDRIENSNEFVIGVEAVQDGIIKRLFSDNEVIHKVNDALLNEGIESFTFQNGAEQYILNVSAFGASDGNISLVCVYKVSNVYVEGYTVIQSVSAALLGLAVIMAIMIGSIVFLRFAARRKIYQLEMIDPFLNCATPKKFKKNVEEILKRHAASKFVLVSLSINNFGYVTEHFGDNASKSLSKFTADTIYRALLLEETFAYAGEGEFLLLLHYRSKQAFSERLNGLYLRLSSFNGFFDDHYKVSVAFAVYEIERKEKQTVKNMLDKLKMAKESATVQSAFFSISFYEDVMHTNYIKKAEIEGKMEQALQNSEFHLFYQPKYNLRSKNMDGSEILIRWYDPTLEKYHVPGEFLPVFEENGFIIKLDHFVFFKACENIAKRVENRKICYPVSVNVSRVTAIQSDFIDYYVRIKKKFGIKDNFITLEFTESFAYENYEFLSNTIDKLHENGLLCSIDDFGTGYSSYNILKSIKMDEIKLDKFFLGKGLSAERDQTLLKSVIEMVKKLDMKVTQEGVETKEDLYRLEELDCDVIQGYYFAKPMKYSDYCEFIEKNFI